MKKEVAYYKQELADKRLEKELESEFQELCDQDKQRKGKGIQIDECTGVLLQETISKITPDPEPSSGPKQIKNMLYNMHVEFEIYGIPRFKVRAILDTGATTCCIDKDSVPAEALE